MHIALLSPGWPAAEFTNGIVTYVELLHAELLRQGHRVSVFTGDIDASNRDAGIHRIVTSLTERVGRRLRRLRHGDLVDVLDHGRSIAASISAVHARDPIDIVEMEESFGWCGAVRRMLPIPVVVKLHGPAFLTHLPEEADELARARIEWEGEALRRVDAIVAPSRNTLARTLARYRLTPTIEQVIANPISVDGAAELWSAARCERKTVLFVGRFDRLKGGDVALLAFGKMLEIDPELRLVFVGPDTGLASQDGPRIHFDEFAGTVFSPSQRARVDYRGKLSRTAITALRTQAMLTIVTSRWENQPNTALEAMAQACPLVCSDGGGTAEVVEHGVTGLLYRAGDVDDLRDKAMELLGDPIRGAGMGRAAHSHVLSHHALQARTRDSLELYGRVIVSACASRRAAPLLRPVP